MKHDEHFLEQHDPDRKDFQIDRIILFSDAVFAIAITLLIIEIKAPEVHEGATTWEMLDQLHHLIPEFSAFISSFFVIAIYWRSHHSIFGFVSDYSSKLIRINNYFLFTIVLMPFSSAYLSENFGVSVPFIFYSFNVGLTGFINYWFIRYVFNDKNKMVKHHPTQSFVHLFKARSIAIPIFFLAAGTLAIFNLFTNPIIYILIWPMFIILEKINARKFKSVPVVNTK